MIKMIALNIKMPKTCMECPCMQTYAIDDENVKNVQHLVRYCAAAKQSMVSIEWKNFESIPYETWVNWPKPKWCPWQTVYEDVDDEESAWHLSMAGLGGSYD